MTPDTPPGSGRCTTATHCCRSTARMTPPPNRRSSTGRDQGSGSVCPAPQVRPTLMVPAAETVVGWSFWARLSDGPAPGAARAARLPIDRRAHRACGGRVERLGRACRRRERLPGWPRPMKHASTMNSSTRSPTNRVVSIEPCLIQFGFGLSSHTRSDRVDHASLGKTGAPSCSSAARAARLWFAPNPFAVSLAMSVTCG
jgi:hypothetical protein